MTVSDGALDSQVPRSILIAALGGEGGGVLAGWIVEAAERAGLPVQATSVPGVAQRTGATSYYIEFMTTPASGGRLPVFALMPVPGRVDVVLASELLEAVRMIERGFVDDSRTVLITARHRVLTTKEKMAMGDGRVDDARLLAAADSAANRCIAIDMLDIAQRHRTVISAVMYGALAGSARLPWGREIDEAVIRASGLGVDASLAGFDEAWRSVATPSEPSIVADDSPALAELVALGEARALDYQDAAYANLYRMRVDRLREAADASPLAQAALEEAARHLALWMSYEDIARVADLKTRKARFDRVRVEAQAAPGDIVNIHEHLCPGLDEVAALLPPAPGRRLRRYATRTTPVGARGRGLTLATNSIHGFALLRLLAGSARWRRHSLRFTEEQTAIEDWLAALAYALSRHAGFALALAGLPRLRKGYSDTFERGRTNFERIVAALVAPVMASGQAPDDAGAQALREAITAALADPGQRALQSALASGAPAESVADASPMKAQSVSRPVGAHPIHWHTRPSRSTTTEKGDH